MSLKRSLKAIQAELEYLRRVRDLADALVRGTEVMEVYTLFNATPEEREEMQKAGLQPDSEELYRFNREWFEGHADNLIAAVEFARRMELTTEKALRFESSQKGGTSETSKATRRR